MEKMEMFELVRMEKLERTIHNLCEKGVRDPKYYLNILQAVNDNRQVDITALSAFLSPSKQFDGFIVYNQWL